MGCRNRLNGDIIITMERRRGLMKINAADESRNGTFGRFRGRNWDGNCGNGKILP